MKHQVKGRMKHQAKRRVKHQTTPVEEEEEEEEAAAAEAWVSGHAAFATGALLGG